MMGKVVNQHGGCDAVVSGPAIVFIDLLTCGFYCIVSAKAYKTLY